MKFAWPLLLAALAFAPSMLARGGAGLAAESVRETQSLPIGDSVSSNWLAAVEAAVPAGDWPKGKWSYGQITNLLCGQAQKGNNAARGLWGMVLLVQSQSPEAFETGLELVRESATNGYVPAMLDLGVLNQTGRYVPKDEVQAFHWFSLAAAAGDAEGELKLGACYHYGLGTAPDLAKTVEFYRLAAGHTNFVAMKSLGYLLMNGIGTARDLDGAKYWLTRAAREGGNRRAMYDLGVLYSMKYPDPDAMREAFQWYLRSAELRDPLGCQQVAECYRNGWGTRVNLVGYHQWIFNAAALGATEAQYEMGLACQLGDGVPKNEEASLAWYRKAAAKNHPQALYNLALYYLNNLEHGSFNLANQYMTRAAECGNREAQFQCALSCFRGDVAQSDFEKGKAWLAEAASNGCPRAEFTLFQLMYNGVAPGPNCPRYPEDRLEAVKWLRRAADGGNLPAQSILAVMLIRGTDMPRNAVEAEKWMRDAADHGYASAQNDLGFGILNGDLSSTDAVEAAMWCQLAKSHWDNPKTLDRVEVNLSNALSRLTPQQRTEVAELVKAFRPEPVPESYPLVTKWDEMPSYQQEDGQFGH